MFNKDDFTLTKLTTAINRRKPVDTFLSRFFQVERLPVTTVTIERGASGLELIDPSARNVPAPNSSLGLTGRGLQRIGSVKLGRVVQISAADIQDIRAFGEEDVLETFDTVLLQKTDPVNRSLDYTEEHLRLGAVRGVQYAADGVTELFNFYTAAGVTAPDAVEFDFTATRGVLLNAYGDVSDYVRDGLDVSAEAGTQTVAIYGKRAWRQFRTSDAVAALYERFLEGAVNRQGVDGRRVPFELFDVTHVPYYGAGMGEDEIRFVPLGTPGMFKTAYTPLDNPEVANTLGLPRYATPEHARFNKGWEVEIATLPIHYVSRPEALIGGVAVGGTSNIFSAGE